MTATSDEKDVLAMGIAAMQAGISLRESHAAGRIADVDAFYITVIIDALAAACSALAQAHGGHADKARMN